MKTIQQYLQELLDQVRTKLGTIPEEIENAYLTTPRHLFVKDFYTTNEHDETIKVELTEANLEEYLPQIYRDGTIGLVLDSEGRGLSSISQPTIVLMMLKKLQIEAGQQILEIGTASGWNAIMMSKLVGEKGHIYSIDIISDLVAQAKERIKKQQITNVSLFDGDGAITTYNQQFDRIMFTVGSYDIPSSIHQQLKSGGLLLMVLKNRSAIDYLILFEKEENHLVSIESSVCGFVPLTGTYAMSELNSKKLEDLPIWGHLKDQVVCEQNFWWGSKSIKTRSRFELKTNGIVSFLSIVEPQFEILQSDDPCFGLIDEENQSMVLWKNNRLIGYGNDKAFNKIKAAFELYLELGMPSATCFKLKVYPMETIVELQENEWLIQRKDSQFVWSLN